MPENNRSQNLLPGVPKIESPFFYQTFGDLAPRQNGRRHLIGVLHEGAKITEAGEPNAAADAYRQAIIVGRTGPDIDQWLGAAQRAMETMA